jgi:hypothetical protein
VNVHGKTRSSPLKNRFANVTPLRLRWHLADNNAWLVASSIAEFEVNVAIRCDPYNHDAPVSEYQSFSRPVRSDCRVICASIPGQLKTSLGVTA